MIPVKNKSTFYGRKKKEPINQKLSKQEVEPLDVSRQNKQLWLVKIPNRVADEWAKSEENAFLGFLTVVKQEAEEAPKYQIKLVPQKSSSQQPLVQHHKMNAGRSLENPPPKKKRIPLSS
uniref:TFIIF beta subunit N-terminal domain-containing protein n=1 Tax=Fibrocapsa japonica TaxID=94617 RepID=A0A7S2UT40_9STRA|mmetsp:Transcript_12024/g.17723  ORF Transcript_12024/g.17723 Transcript_12024/m.17723 type:complete len:120 (+) Transcript_12024:132-491(+)